MQCSPKFTQIILAHYCYTDTDQLGLILSQPDVLVVLVLGHKVPEPDGGERHEAEVDGVEEVPLLGVDKHEGP